MGRCKLWVMWRLERLLLWSRKKIDDDWLLFRFVNCFISSLYIEVCFIYWSHSQYLSLIFIDGHYSVIEMKSWRDELVRKILLKSRKINQLSYLFDKNPHYIWKLTSFELYWFMFSLLVISLVALFNPTFSIISSSFYRWFPLHL